VGYCAALRRPVPPIGFEDRQPTTELDRRTRHPFRALALAAGLLASGCGSAPAAVTVPAPPAGAPPLAVGVVANTLNAGRAMGAQQQAVRKLGARWIREELGWAEVERRPGAHRWQRFDRLLASAVTHRLHVLPVLLGTPRWAGPSPLGLPDDPAAFGAFAGRAAARYGPGGSFWRAHPRLDDRLAPRWFELWNEPYMPYFSKTGIDPARYARMVVAATSAGRAANPRTRWLMAADLTYLDASGQRRPWLDALYADQPNLSRYFDGVAVHPYSFYPPGTAAGIAAAFRFDRIDPIARALARHGAKDTPLWITEVGWSTCDLRPDCVSEHDEAQRLADAFTLVRSRYARLVRAIFVYHLRDFPGGAGNDREAHYGLLRANGTRKPAWAVLRMEALAAAR
jgi:hypothetical protein